MDVIKRVRQNMDVIKICQKENGCDQTCQSMDVINHRVEQCMDVIKMCQTEYGCDQNVSERVWMRSNVSDRMWM